MAIALISSPTPANGRLGVNYAVCGETVDKGASVRLNNGLLYETDSETLAEAQCDGVSLQGGAVNEAVPYMEPGGYINCTGLVAGTVYYAAGNTLSNEGEVGLLSDMSSATEYLILVGVAVSTTKMRILGIETGVQKA